MFLVLTLPSGAWCQLEKGSYLGTATAGLAFSTYKDILQVMIPINTGTLISPLTVDSGFLSLTNWQ